MSNDRELFLVVFQMKRALVLGASALIILALNQNTISEVILGKAGSH